jgi:hypothetical protein
MLSASDRLQRMRAEYLREVRARRLFFVEISGPLVTWAAIALTYKSLETDSNNTLAWGSAMLALFVFHIGLAACKSRRRE